MQITLKNVRLAFVAVHEAEDFNGDGKFKFKTTALIDPKDPQVKELENVILEVAKEAWKDKAPATLKSIKAAGKALIQDGDAKEYDGFPGMLYVAASNEVRPLVMDRNKTPLVEEDGKPYSGSYGDVSITVWAQDNNYGKRVNAKLRGVRFLKDGDAFGSGNSVAKEDEFDDLEVADGDDLA